MKKKESLWELLSRLDDQAGQFNLYFAEANRYFDITADMTKTLLDRHERDFNRLIGKVKKALKLFLKRR